MLSKRLSKKLLSILRELVVSLLAIWVCSIAVILLLGFVLDNSNPRYLLDSGDWVFPLISVSVGLSIAIVLRSTGRDDE